LAAVLCLIHLVEIGFIVAAVSSSFSTWWTLFTLNRLFELTLLYLIGASLFRLHLRRRHAKSGAPFTGWRANFMAG
jgi:nitrogen fixation/metabolism regulation signal transduction histidine kinase